MQSRTPRECYICFDARDIYDYIFTLNNEVVWIHVYVLDIPSTPGRLWVLGFWMFFLSDYDKPAYAYN